MEEINYPLALRWESDGQTGLCWAMQHFSFSVLSLHRHHYPSYHHHHHLHNAHPTLHHDYHHNDNYRPPSDWAIFMLVILEMLMFAFVQNLHITITNTIVIAILIIIITLIILTSSSSWWWWWSSSLWWWWSAGFTRRPLEC